MLLLPIFLLVSLFLLVVYKELFSKPRGYPPGPRWLPIVGNSPQLKKLSKKLGGQHLALVELAKRYKTNVLGLKLGRDYVVTVFSYPTVRKVLTEEVFEGRPDNFFLRLRCMGQKRGITCTDGDLWSIQRSFVVRHLRDLGFGKKPMETMVQEEIAQLLPILKEESSKSRLGKVLAPAIINILWRLTTGSRIDRSDNRLDQLLDLLEMRSKAFDMAGGTLSQFPWLRFVAPKVTTGIDLIEKMNDQLKSIVMETVEEHQKNWTPERDDDLIYSYITEMKKTNGHPTTFTYDQLVMVCLDLFIAGSQTTSNTLDFAFLMMVMHPDVQTKVHESIDEHSADTNFLEYMDRRKVPYIEAVLLEVERFYTITPTIGPRRVLRDTLLEGHVIPKGATVLISLHSIHHDKDFWKDPDQFRPERFLDSNGRLLSQERIISFGLGRRRCLGEALAKTCIFLFFVQIMKKYRLSLMPDAAPPSGRPLPGITLSPEDYRAVFIER